jgi:large repetitive protein
LSITVNPQPLTIVSSSLPSGTVNAVYGPQTLTVSGGTPPYTWSVASGTLPQGLSLSQSGTLSSTPTTAGTSTFSVQVQDSASQIATQSFNLTINPAPSPLTIVTSVLPAGTVNVLYNQSLTASGGTPPYTWSVTSGTLPQGLSLPQSGTPSGIPTTAGTSTFTVQVQDNVSATATQSFNLTINPAPLTIVTNSLASGTVNVAYNQSLTASGGTPPYSWSVTSGSLPQGLSLSQSGTISGTPTGTGASTFTVQVQDNAVQIATQSFNLTINLAPPPISITGLVGYWSFDNGTANDNSGNGNNGTLINNPSVVAGKSGQALSFNGSTQYVNVGSVLNPGSGNLSVFAWVKTTQAGGLNMIVSKRNSSVATNGGYQLFQNGSGALSFTFGDGNSSRVRIDSSGPRINDGNWHSVGVVFTRTGNGVIYVDGAPAAGGSGSITSQSGFVNNSLPLRFGVEDQTGQGFLYWNGAIDEVRIYNRALSAQEISDLYNNAPTT